MKNNAIFQKTIHAKAKPSRKIFLLRSLLLCAVLMLAACGQAEKKEDPIGVVEEPAVTYKASQTMLPDPGKDIEEHEIYKNYAYTDYLNFLQGERVVRIGTLYSEEEKKMAYVIQCLDPPYEKWQTEYLIGARLINVCRTEEENGELLLLLYVTLDKDHQQYCLARWKDGEILSQKALGLELREENQVGARLSWQMDDQENSTFRGENTVYRYDAEFRLLGADSVAEKPQGLQQIATVGVDGAYYMANEKALYRQGDEMMCTYANSGIWTDRAVDLTLLSEDQFLLLAEADEQSCLLRIEPGEIRDVRRQEVVIAGDISAYVRKCAAEFNKRNFEYQIILEDFDIKKEYYSDFLGRIQLEISAGRGPDLLSGACLNLEAYAEQGYLDALDDLVGDESAYISQAMENCRVNGKLYCLPYACQINTLMAYRDVIGDRTSWTWEELQAIASEQEVPVFHCGADVWDIVNSCALMDEENGLVDWEKGQAHFDRESFLQILEFAQTHTDTQQSNLSSVTEYVDMKNREQLVKWCCITDLDSYFYMRKYYPEGVFVGYPSENGTGNYLTGKGFVLNHNSACKEGARAFLEYLISEDGQRYVLEADEIPVRLDSVEQGLAAARDQKMPDVEDEKKQEWTEDFRELLAGCRPAGRRYDEIRTIVLQEMEESYGGTRPLKEMADVIQNRVQLYLNEQSFEF